MGNFSKPYQKLTIFLLITSVLVVFSCASVRQPTGGPKDTTPPKVLSESPKNLSRNIVPKIIEIEFDEYFKLSNEFKEISISPAMERSPLFKVKKKVLEITFQDSLQKNTTYTINFGKGLIDYNEGNILKNYSYVFATGPIIDSLTLSGNIKNSISKKPELEATVFILPIAQDSLFGKKRASLFTTTDSSGNFYLKNLHEGSYKIYALKEETGGGDRIYNSANEDIGFQKEPIILNKNVSGINLEIFKQDPAIFRVLDYKIFNDGHMLFAFNKTLENPSLRILSPQELDSQKNVEFNNRNDSGLLWLPKMDFDSLKVSVEGAGISYDTLTLRRGKKDTYTAPVSISDNIEGTLLKPRTDLLLTLSSPISSIDEKKITLLEDSVATTFRIVKDTSSVRRYKIIYPWKIKRQYILKVEENAFTNPLALKNKLYTHNFILDNIENYGNLILNITLTDPTKTYLVQLIRNQNEVLRTDSITKNGPVEYRNFPSGKYTLRIIYDDNKNGKWDTGNVSEQRQPEMIWNYNKEITLRPNWDLEEKITVP